MKLKEAEAEERRKELIKKRQTAVMTLKASFAANQVQLISRMCCLLSCDMSVEAETVVELHYY